MVDSNINNRTFISFDRLNRRSADAVFTVLVFDGVFCHVPPKIDEQFQVMLRTLTERITEF